MEQQKLNKFAKLAAFVKKHKLPIIIVSVALVVTAGILGYLYFVSNNLKAQESTPIAKAPEPPKVKYFSPLSGLEVPDEATTKKQVKAVMIENSPSARPQSGLNDAGVIFEAIAEGGITRFLIFYQESSPDLIGPVRSLRPYYVDWLAAFDATVSHVGGSKNALDEIRNGTYKDIDQFFNGAYYWRATDRYAPHNVYTSTQKLDELNEKKGYTSSSFTGFERKDEEPSETPDATSIDIDISYNLFNVHYDYDKPTNSYTRYEAGEPHKDREAGQLQPKNVIVIKVPAEIAFEDGYREQMTTLGSGEATIFIDGTVHQGTWEKPDKKSQIVFKDDSGELIKLNRGQTWISVIAPEKSVVWQ
ncbi:MAG: DUF3048 domain-containing protein [Candidatus Woesebacteria bacterium]|jgi:hypothetical protein